MKHDENKNTIMLQYAGIPIKQTITSKEVAEYTSLCLAPSDAKQEFSNQIRDALALLDMAFDLRNRFGFATLFGTDEFKSYLLHGKKGD